MKNDNAISDCSENVYIPPDIARILKISRTTAYSFVGEAYKKQEPFQVRKIGKSLRVPKASFDRWLEG